MVDFKRLTDKAKDLVAKRGGTDALKDDAAELKDIATRQGQPRRQGEGCRGRRSRTLATPAATSPSPWPRSRPDRPESATSAPRGESAGRRAARSAPSVAVAGEMRPEQRLRWRSAPVAQRIERLPSKQRVGGSTPPGGAR